MKRTLLLLLVLVFGVATFAQQRAYSSKELRNRAVQKTPATKGGEVSAEAIIPGASYKSILDESEIGTTYYDLQSNRGMQERIYLHDDGTIGAVWTRGPLDNPGGPERGTGYNYYDGVEWVPDPTEALDAY